VKKEDFKLELIQYLKNTFPDVLIRIEKNDSIPLNSGDNGILMRGPFAGYSLCGLIEFLAQEMNKKTVYIDEY
jgi:hypothetical protein